MIILCNVFLLVTISDSVQVWEIPIQINIVGIGAADQEVLSTLKQITINNFCIFSKSSIDSNVSLKSYYIFFIDDRDLTLSVEVFHPSGFMLGIKCILVESINFLTSASLA